MRCLVLAPLVLFVAGTVVAQDPTSTPEPPCSSPEHRQFDFWVGDWSVKDGDGQVAGSNRIEKILGGCVLWEQWRGAGGSTGFSYNLYDAARGVWHQTWVDGNGGMLSLDGGLEGSDMVLRGERPAQDGSGTVQHEIRWTPLEDGRVRQHWRASKDGGATWKDLFVGYYART
jgi:hypothetical protein